MQNPSRTKAPTAARKMLPNTANTMSPGSRPKLVGLGLPARGRSLEPNASSMVVGPVHASEGVKLHWVAKCVLTIESLQVDSSHGGVIRVLQAEHARMLVGLCLSWFVAPGIRYTHYQCSSSFEPLDKHAVGVIFLNPKSSSKSVDKICNSYHSRAIFTHDHAVHPEVDIDKNTTEGRGKSVYASDKKKTTYDSS